MRLFVTGTGTGVGKTYASGALLREWTRQGLRPAGIKPLETGCAPAPLDAEALADACGRPDLATLPGLYRARLPAAPFAATLEGEPPPAWAAIVETLRAVPDRPLLIEGAGGPLVPVDETHVVVDLARELDAEVLLVAADRLGVLSHALTAAEAIAARGLRLSAVLLTHPTLEEDPAVATNARILRRWLGGTPVFELGHASDDVAALATHLLQLV